LGGRKSIRPVKTDWWGAGVVIWSEVQTCIWPISWRNFVKPRVLEKVPDGSALFLEIPEFP